MLRSFRVATIDVAAARRWVIRSARGTTLAHSFHCHMRFVRIETMMSRALIEFDVGVVVTRYHRRSPGNRALRRKEDC